MRGRESLTFSATAALLDSTPEIPQFRFFGQMETLEPSSVRAMFNCKASSILSVRPTVEEIIGDVRNRGDVALLEMTRRFDSVALESLEVSRSIRRRALDGLKSSVRRALERAHANIQQVHRDFRPHSVQSTPEPGITVVRRPDPLERVGIYAPGGRAAYPSSLLMGAVPARVAGVNEVVVCSPPSSDALPPQVVLAAAELANVDRLFAIGGAGAIAAMAYGTETVPRVDRIVGPGSARVAAAKLLVANDVGIDLPAGPSELLIIADGSADPELIAREMLAQAEHDPDSVVMVLVVDDGACRSDRLIIDISRSVGAALTTAPRFMTIRESFASAGGIVGVGDYSDAVRVANELCSEHVLILVRDEKLGWISDSLRNAGTIFVGSHSSVVFGDYMTGANHVLPTGRHGRWHSGLSTNDFIRWTTIQRVSSAAASSLAAEVAELAEAEGLSSHANAARAYEVASHVESPVTLSDDNTSIDSIEAETSIDLSKNTNLYGTPPTATKLVARSARTGVNRYPSPYSSRLKRAIADYVGVDTDCVTTGCGSDGVLGSAMLALGGFNSVLAASDPTFTMIPVLAGITGMNYRCATELPDHQPDIDALLAFSPRILYLCSPGNPTGVLLDRTVIKRALGETRAHVILDEAYVEFASESAAVLATQCNSLLVVRTLSKAFGLAGLRVGYAVGAPEAVREIEKARGPYRVSAVAEEAAVAALSNDIDWVRDAALMTIENRSRLTKELRERGLEPLDSAANFVCLPVSNADAYRQRLASRGINVRSFSGLPHLGDALRVTAGPWHLMERFLQAFDEISSEISS